MKHLAAAVPLVAGLGLLSLKWMQRRTKNPRGLPFPPGPGRWPVIGNLPEIPTEKEWLTYSEWAKSYGAWACYYHSIRELTWIVTAI